MMKTDYESLSRQYSVYCWLITMYGFSVTVHFINSTVISQEHNHCGDTLCPACLSANARRAAGEQACEYHVIIMWQSCINLLIPAAPLCEWE